MTSIHITGDDEVTAEDAARVTKKYNPSIQETTEEVADEPADNTPISDEERKALDDKQAPTFQAPFQDGDLRDRAERFQPPGEWESPVIKARRRREMMLPNRGAANDLEKRVNAIALLDGAPKPVQEGVRAAREAIADLRAAYEAGSHPDNPRYALNQQAKDDVIVKVAEVTRVVVALEAVAQRADLQDEWFANLSGGMEAKRQDALKALRAAEKAYASFRGAVGSAQGLAVKQGRWDGGWHRSVVSEVDLNRVLPELKKTIDFVDPESETSDDYTTGRFLTAEYEEGTLPPHTMAQLQRVGDLAGSGTFPRQIFLRAKARSSEDRALQEALATKRLQVFLNSNPYQPKRDDIAGGIA